MTTDAPNKQDATFAGRLAQRDESVLRDIEKAYAGPLRKLLGRFRGPRLNDHDIDDIVARALEDTWNAYEEPKGASVRSFYFLVAKRRLQDRLRESVRRQETVKRCAPMIVRSEANADSSPDHATLNRELLARNTAITKLIGDALLLLSERQRIAFKRRFATGGGEHWAKELEAETAKPAKQWRKASDEARARVLDYLVKHGVYYSQEGDSYEVARTSRSA